jgi:mannose-6-phosphate isomerase-like protein (cupin superfamily)
MLVKKTQTKELSNSNQCKVRNYDIPSKILSAATAIIEGKYPSKNRVVNTECEETYYVISGEGTIHSDKGDFKVKTGDLYFFEKNEAYWVEGKKLFVYISNSPPFQPKQHKNIN